MSVSQASTSTTNAHSSEGLKFLIHPKYIRIVLPEAYQTSNGPTLLSNYLKSAWGQTAWVRDVWDTYIPQQVADVIQNAPLDFQQRVWKGLRIKPRFEWEHPAMEPKTRNLIEDRYVSPSCGHAHP